MIHSGYPAPSVCTGAPPARCPGGYPLACHGVLRARGTHVPFARSFSCWCSSQRDMREMLVRLGVVGAMACRPHPMPCCSATSLAIRPLYRGQCALRPMPARCRLPLWAHACCACRRGSTRQHHCWPSRLARRAARCPAPGRGHPDHEGTTSAGGGLERTGHRSKRWVRVVRRPL